MFELVHTGFVPAPWYGHAVAFALVIILSRIVWHWTGDLADRITAHIAERRARSFPLPSHVRARLDAESRETARRWR